MVECAGILLYKTEGKDIFVLLVKSGNPYDAETDWLWSIPKGKVGRNESPFNAAIREMEEETGFVATDDVQYLGVSSIDGGKKKNLHIWAHKSNFDETTLDSIKKQVEWPPNSGKLVQYPEIAEAKWFLDTDAKKVLSKKQRVFINRLNDAISLENSLAL